MSDVHILAQAMINAAPEDHKKLIIFADSRQDAAFQAGWMQDHARRIRLRHMMHQVIAEKRLAAAARRHHRQAHGAGTAKTRTSSIPCCPN